MRTLFSLILLTVLLTPSLQSRAEQKIVSRLSASFGIDYVASSVEDDIREKIPSDEKIYINSAVPVNLRYGFSFTDPKIPNYYPGGYQGISVGVLNFGSLQPRGFSNAYKNIGYPFLAYIFQGAPFWHRNSFSLNYEWNFGAAFGWKSYSEQNKYLNLAVGSQVNAYLHLGLTLNYQIDPNVSIFGGVGVSHFSNGNTSFPNPGVNSFGLRFGMVYTLNPLSNGFQTVIRNDSVKERRVFYDISLWGASRKRVYRGGKEPVLLAGHFACAGISFAPMVRLITWWRVGGSLDLQYDQSSDKKHDYIEGDSTDDIKFFSPSFGRQLSLGLSAHGELRMPIFTVNVGIGYNFISPLENRGSYQNITLKTYLCRYLYLNVGYQLRNFHQQSSLMLGLGTTI